VLTRSDPVPSPGLGSNYDLDAGSPPVLRHAGVICSRHQICQRSFRAKIVIESPTAAFRIACRIFGRKKTGLCGPVLFAW